MSKSQIDLDPELVEGFIQESLEMLEDVETRFVELEKTPQDRSNIDAIFRSIHSIKGNSAYFNWTHIKVFAHNLENVLDELRQGKRTVTAEVVDALIRGSRILKELVQKAASAQPGGEVGSHEKLFLQSLDKLVYNIASVEDSLMRFYEQMNSFVQTHESETSLNPEVLLGKIKAIVNDQRMKLSLVTKPIERVSLAVNSNETAAQTSSSPDPAAGETSKTLRVSTDKVDEFMNYVGELIIMSDLFNNIQKSLEKWKMDSDLTTDFKQAYLAFDKLSSGLQKSLMEVRKIPVKSLLQKIPRIVRDLARQQGKEVDVVISGAEVLIDKSLIDDMEAPMVHMVRNAVDHGLETAEERTQAGKPAKGSITVSAETQQEHFILTIRDDGRGMSPAGIRTAAVKKGVVSESQASQLSDEEAINLIFRPGFSTREAVTDVSGRGVGMDVVLKNVQKCKGSVEVTSTMGKGSTLTIKLPLSAILMVENGLMVRVRGDRYLIPADAIREIIPFGARSAVSSIGTAQVLNVRGSLYPLLETDRLLGYPAQESRNDESRQAIVIRHRGDGGCLVVDEIIGIQQVVVREMDERFKRGDLIKGVALLGHSKPVIVLEVAAILESIRRGSKVYELAPAC